jgi:integrase/recombinase XerC
MYKSTRDLHRTAALLGHASVNTSAIYAKMDLEGLHEAMELADEALKEE